MNILVQTSDETTALNNQPEVWVQVTGMEPLPDWPTIRTQVIGLRPDLEVPQLPSAFYPGGKVTGDDGEILHRFEDWWIFPLKAAEPRRIA